MSRSSTPARIITPIRVRLSASHIPIPMRTAAAKMTSRTSGYCRNTASPLDLTATHDGRRDRAQQIVGGIDLDGVAAPDPHHQIGEDDRKSERHQRLAQILPLHPPKDEELHGDADDGGSK